jgi:hypothetical protein
MSTLKGEEGRLHPKQAIWVNFKYCTSAVITRNLYIYQPDFEDYFFAFKVFIQKILSLCKAKLI